MFSTDRILALNIGAGKILLAEFSVKSGKPPVLLNYGSSDLGTDPENDVGIGGFLPSAIRQIMKEKGIRPAPLMLCLSGQMVFPRFVRLPAVGEEKLLQMVEYEVEQNVPFPLDEIVWNYQFIGDATMGEQAAMIVAAKIENVRDVTEGVSAMGLEPEVVDVAPMALYNCLKFNEPSLDGCTILLDIGSRATNLIFIEDEKIYSRCIPVAGNVITQEIAKGFGISFEEAEIKKRGGAFVSLGGTYAVEDPDAERMSKIVRNVATRLHAEISRSINFYRSQQEGGQPGRLILTGGSSVIPHLDTFFREKLHVEVSFLNPFTNVTFGPKVDPAALESDAFVLAESVGLALRRTLACPVEINLMPPEIIKRKSFKKRIPFFALAFLGILASLFIWTMNQNKMRGIIESQREKVDAKLSRLNAEKSRLNKAAKSFQDQSALANAEAALMSERSSWIKRIDAIRRSLFDGIWLTDLTTVPNEQKQVAGIRIKGCLWKDKMVAVQNKIQAAGKNLTAVEYLCDNLRKQSVFSKDPKDISIEGSRDVGGYVVEFTVRAAFASDSAADDEKKDVRKR